MPASLSNIFPPSLSWFPLTFVGGGLGWGTIAARLSGAPHILIPEIWSPTRRSMTSVGLPRRTGEARSFADLVQDEDAK